MNNQTDAELRQLRSQLRELRAEMKRKGIRKISPFNGGLTSDEMRMNEMRFSLEARINNRKNQ